MWKIKPCHLTLPGCGKAAGNMCGKDKICSNSVTEELLQPVKAHNILLGLTQWQIEHSSPVQKR